MNLTILATEGKVIPEIDLIMDNNCFYNMKERSCKLRSVWGGLPLHAKFLSLKLEPVEVENKFLKILHFQTKLQ